MLDHHLKYSLNSNLSQRLTHLVFTNLSFSELDRLSILDLLTQLYEMSLSSALVSEFLHSKCARDVAWKQT